MTRATALSRPDWREHQRKPWKIVVGRRAQLWGRYATELDALSAARKLRRHGIAASVEREL